ncbi:unnamed protein product [Blumeria hordei]|uniref:Uncharacterized protein n=1 Tax=Blumeria hordei TaxID=2867405 RepID=A0A383UZ54_BLUHO|nr:unnamed protein product [Blumeria hordei]
MNEPASKSYSMDPTLWLYTSLTSGSSHIITATSRMETILKANRIPFRALDLATDEKARMLWGRRAGKDESGRQRKIPGLVQMGMVIGDIVDVEDWNEYGELKQHIKIVPIPGVPVLPIVNPTFAKHVKPVMKPIQEKILASPSTESQTSKSELSMNLTLRQVGLEVAQKAKGRKQEPTTTFDGVGEAENKKEDNTVTKPIMQSGVELEPRKESEAESEPRLVETQPTELKPISNPLDIPKPLKTEEPVPGINSSPKSLETKEPDSEIKYKSKSLEIEELNNNLDLTPNPLNLRGSELKFISEPSDSQIPPKKLEPELDLNHLKTEETNSELMLKPNPLKIRGTEQNLTSEPSQIPEISKLKAKKTTKKLGVLLPSEDALRNFDIHTSTMDTLSSAQSHSSISWNNPINNAHSPRYSIDRLEAMIKSPRHPIDRLESRQSPNSTAWKPVSLDQALTEVVSAEKLKKVASETLRLSSDE